MFCVGDCLCIVFSHVLNMQECVEWPSVPNEWPEASRIEEAEEIYEEEVIEQTNPEDDAGDNRSTTKATPSFSNIIAPVVGKKGSVVLTLSSEDMEKHGIEYFVQQMMEECCLETYRDDEGE